MLTALAELAIGERVVNLGDFLLEGEEREYRRGYGWF